MEQMFGALSLSKISTRKEQACIIENKVYSTPKDRQNRAVCRADSDPTKYYISR